MQGQLSKYCLCEPIPDLKATTIAETMARGFISQFGAPRAILTDRGAAFTSGLLREIAKIFKIRQLRTSGYRLQTNGAFERSHRVYKTLYQYMTTGIGYYPTKNSLTPQEYTRLLILHLMK